MICPGYPDPQYLLFSKQVPNLLYYSHIPALVVSLSLGFFVYFKNKTSLLSKLLLTISLSFSLWVFFNLIAWTNNESQIIMLVWPFFSIIYALLCITCLYFTYVFIDEKDVGFSIKLVWSCLLLPVMLLAATKYNVNIFELSVLCGAIDEGVYFQNYFYGIGFLSFLWTLVLLISRYRRPENKERRRQLMFLGIGVELFLLSFFVTGYIAGLLTENSYSIEFYGIFGMTVFMGLLAYLIVKYHAFHIKLLATQALVAALVIGVGSQYFFIQSDTNKILNGITLILALGFGYMLIKSVRTDVQRKEELQEMSDKLANANDHLRELDNAKSEFISIASHQLRTPLTAIKGFISLALEGSYGKVEPKLQETLNKVYLSNERLINLVEDLLNISRIESGRMEYKFDKWSLEKICEEIIDTFVLKAKDRNLYLDYKKPENVLPEVTTDGMKLREVISNIVDNAVKYTQRGGVTLRVAHEGENLRVVVSDTGIGIPSAELPYLFSKFSRGKDTKRLHTGGTGLGLYVGKSIVEALGGKIWAESEGAGKGSRFIIEVPIEKSENLQV